MAHHAELFGIFSAYPAGIVKRKDGKLTGYLLDVAGAGLAEMRGDDERRNIVRSDIAIEETGLVERDALSLKGGVKQMGHCEM